MEPSEWRLDDFDERYNERDDIIKRISHVRLELDFAVLFRTFVDDHVIMNSIRSIRKALMVKKLPLTSDK